MRALINILVEKGVVRVEELSEQLRLSANEELVIIEAALTEQYDAKFKFDSDQENAKVHPPYPSENPA